MASAGTWARANAATKSAQAASRSAIQQRNSRVWAPRARSVGIHERPVLSRAHKQAVFVLFPHAVRSNRPVILCPFGFVITTEGGAFLDQALQQRGRLPVRPVLVLKLCHLCIHLCQSYQIRLFPPPPPPPMQPTTTPIDP